eukprot:jgi/Tetstr1/423634/TSEL_001406.t1
MAAPSVVGPGVPLLRAAAADDGRAAYDEVEATAAAVQPTRRRSSFDALFKELGEVMRFSLPAVGIFLVNPLMTLVDTAFLGGTAVGQAALQPSGAVLDYPTILLSFLAVGTTGLIARDPQSTQNTMDVLRPALCLGLALGMGLAVWTQLGAPYILNGLGVRPEVYESAMTYIRIRQLFCPLVLVCSIAQSAHLASKDVYTPLKLVILSGCINCLGDMLLVGKLGLGVAGAAWATVASQFALVGGLLLSLRRAGKLPSLLPLPRLREYEPFVDFAKGITMINLLRVAGFSSITYYASSSLSTQHLAAQQVLASIFIFLSFISQPLTSACQTFLPSLLPGGSAPDIGKARSTMFAIFSTALCLGVTMGGIGTLVTYFGHGIFTSDPAVVTHMHGALLPILYCHLVSPIALAVDAVLVASKDLDSLCWIQAVGLATLLGLMSTCAGMGLSAIWLAYGSHLLVRLALCSWRVGKIPGLHLLR